MLDHQELLEREGRWDHAVLRVNKDHQGQLEMKDQEDLQAYLDSLGQPVFQVQRAHLVHRDLKANVVHLETKDNKVSAGSDLYTFNPTMHIETINFEH